MLLWERNAAGHELVSRGTSAPAVQELSAIHFFTEAFFAAPASALPSLLTAAVSQHFLIAEFFAAPASGLPSLLIASFLHEPCAAAGFRLAGDTNAVALTKHRSVAMVMVRVIGASFLRWRPPAPDHQLTMPHDPDKPSLKEHRLASFDAKAI